MKKGAAFENMSANPNLSRGASRSSRDPLLIWMVQKVIRFAKTLQMDTTRFV